MTSRRLRDLLRGRSLWAWNSRIFPGISPLVVSNDNRVPVRVGNPTMTNHSIHMHATTSRHLHGRQLSEYELGRIARPEGQG